MIRSDSDSPGPTATGPTAAMPRTARRKVESSIASVFTFGIMRIAAAGIFFAALVGADASFALLAGIVLVFSEGPRLLCRLSLHRVRFTAEPSRNRLFPGERAGFSVRCENRKAVPADIEVRLSLRRLTVPASRDPAEIGMEARQSAVELGRRVRLLWFQETAFTLESSPLERGVYSAAPIQLSGTDPFGLFRSSSRIPGEQEILVVPRIRPIRPVPQPVSETLGDRPAAGPIGDPAFFAGVREYDPGRPSRHIHWKASARHGALLEKLFEPTAREGILLLLDAAGFADAGDEQEFELALSAAASIAFSLHRRGIAVGLAADVRRVGAGGRSGDGLLVIAPDTGPPGRIFEALARMVPERSGDWDRLRQRLPRLFGGNTGICIGLRPADTERVRGLLPHPRGRGGMLAFSVRSGGDAAPSERSSGNGTMPHDAGPHGGVPRRPGSLLLLRELFIEREPEPAAGDSAAAAEVPGA